MIYKSYFCIIEIIVKIGKTRPLLSTSIDGPQNRLAAGDE
jgi:hypothetical protein